MQKAELTNKSRTARTCSLPCFFVEYQVLAKYSVKLIMGYLKMRLWIIFYTSCILKPTDIFTLKVS